MTVGGHRRFELVLIGWGLPTNLLWELAQSPLFADHAESWRYVAWTRLHCSVGDVLILLGAFWATAAVFGSRSWPVTRGREAASLFVGFGIAYTLWSEWFNTAVRAAWQYSPAMPRVLGIGLLPVLQWAVVPTLLIFLMRLPAGRSRSTGECT